MFLREILVKKAHCFAVSQSLQGVCVRFILGVAGDVLKYNQDPIMIIPKWRFKDVP